MYCTMVETNQRQSKESLTANQLYMSSVSKQWATSKFWNLYCKAASPAKAIFNLLLGCGPQLFSFTKKAHKMLCKTTMKGMPCVWSHEHAIFPCSESTRQALFPTWSLVVSLSGHIGTTWTPQNTDGMKDIWAQTHSASNRREKCWDVVSVVIMWSVSDSYRTECALCS